MINFKISTINLAITKEEALLQRQFLCKQDRSGKVQRFDRYAMIDDRTLWLEIDYV